MKRALLIYDGDCGFCQASARRGRRTTGDAVDYAPFQQVAKSFPQIPAEAFQKAVFLVEPGGKITSAAEAVFRVLELGGYSFGARLYRSSRLVRVLAESAYRWVAAHRGWLGRRLGLEACRIDPGGGTIAP